MAQKSLLLERSLLPDPSSLRPRQGDQTLLHYSTLPWRGISRPLINNLRKGRIIQIYLLRQRRLCLPPDNQRGGAAITQLLLRGGVVRRVRVDQPFQEILYCPSEECLQTPIIQGRQNLISAEGLQTEGVPCQASNLPELDILQELHEEDLYWACGPLLEIDEPDQAPATVWAGSRLWLPVSACGGGDPASEVL